MRTFKNELVRQRVKINFIKMIPYTKSWNNNVISNYILNILLCFIFIHHFYITWIMIMYF